MLLNKNHSAALPDTEIEHIATLDLEERPILEDGLSGLIKSDLTNRPPTPTHPPTPVQMDC